MTKIELDDDDINLIEEALMEINGTSSIFDSIKKPQETAIKQRIEQVYLKLRPNGDA